MPIHRSLLITPTPLAGPPFAITADDAALSNLETFGFGTTFDDPAWGAGTPVFLGLGWRWRVRGDDPGVRLAGGSAHHPRLRVEAADGRIGESVTTVLVR